MAWDIETNYYLKSFFGLVSTDKLNGFNDRSWDVKYSNRYAWYQWRIFSIASILESRFGIKSKDWNNNLTYWSLNLGGEMHVQGAGDGFVFYVKYFLDEMPTVIALPRFSKDRLLQVGIRFIK